MICGGGEEDCLLYGGLWWVVGFWGLNLLFGSVA